jgi:SAM-dependent methyltransferase
VIHSEVLAFVRANLPPAPTRVLEIGAGDGALAQALRAAGYDVVAIDPEPTGGGVRACALHQLDEPAASFAAAVAVVSLHHVEPLAESLQRLAEMLEPAGLLLVDEFDVGAFDRRAAEWWLQQRRTLGAHDHATPEEIVDEHRRHLHPLGHIVEALRLHFDTSRPVRGAYLYRWDLDESVRTVEEDLIGRGQLPAVGARFVGRRLTPD